MSFRYCREPTSCRVLATVSEPDQTQLLRPLPHLQVTQDLFPSRHSTASSLQGRPAGPAAGSAKLGTKTHLESPRHAATRPQYQGVWRHLSLLWDHLSQYPAFLECCLMDAAAAASIAVAGRADSPVSVTMLQELLGPASPQEYHNWIGHCQCGTANHHQTTCIELLQLTCYPSYPIS